MSRNYDNRERLVRAVLQREHNRQLALISDASTDNSSASSSFRSHSDTDFRVHSGMMIDQSVLEALLERETEGTHTAGSPTSVIVHFRSLERPKEDEFCLELAKNHTYDDVVERVAQHLGLDDPSKIRLTPHNCYSQQPKPNPIKYRSVDHLLDMLVHYNQISDILYYEVLDIPLPELQCLKTLKVAFHHATKDEALILNIRLPKQSTVGDVLNEIKTKVELSHPNAELRLLEVFYHKIYKIFTVHEKIENINDQYWTLRAEEIPEEEKNLGPKEKLIHVYHFTKETAQNQVQVQNFGEPFFLVIHEGETLADVKLRVQKKLQVPEEEFSKWKFAFLSLGRPEYLDDSDVVSSRFQRRDVYGAWEQYLGLEHSDTTPKRSYAASQVIEENPFLTLLVPTEVENAPTVENQASGKRQKSRFTWKIQNFSKLNMEKLYSDIFVVGSYKWRVLIFPRGNKVDYLSMYLDVADSATLPCGWRRYAEFSLAVVNQLHNEYTVKKDTLHEFSPKESDWGFTAFMNLNDLNDPNNGYIENDLVVVEADVVVDNIDYWKETSIVERLKEEQGDNEDEKRDTPEAHLYTIIKVARDADLKDQIGKDIYFDLVDHDKVRNFRVQKQMPLLVLKEEVAKEFDIPVQFQRLWIWGKRQNCTYRPYRPLTPQEEGRTVGSWKQASRDAHTTELNLFLEVEYGMDLRPIPPPEKNKQDILLFFKLYDPQKAELRFVGRFFVKRSGKPIEIIKRLNEMAGFGPDEAIELFEEVRVEPNVMCERLHNRETFQFNQLEDGDIVCFQKRPSPEMERRLRFPYVASFLEYVKDRQAVSLLQELQCLNPLKIESHHATKDEYLGLEHSDTSPKKSYAGTHGSNIPSVKKPVGPEERTEEQPVDPQLDGMLLIETEALTTEGPRAISPAPFGPNQQMPRTTQMNNGLPSIIDGVEQREAHSVPAKGEQSYTVPVDDDVVEEIPSELKGVRTVADEIWHIMNLELEEAAPHISDKLQMILLKIKDSTAEGLTPTAVAQLQNLMWAAQDLGIDYVGTKFAMADFEQSAQVYHKMDEMVLKAKNAIEVNEASMITLKAKIQETLTTEVEAQETIRRAEEEIRKAHATIKETKRLQETYTESLNLKCSEQEQLNKEYKVWEGRVAKSLPNRQVYEQRVSRAECKLNAAHRSWEEIKKTWAELEAVLPAEVYITAGQPTMADSSIRSPGEEE